jgi:hypothetical protein
MAALAAVATAMINLALKAVSISLVKRKTAVTSSHVANVPATRGHVTLIVNNVAAGVASGRGLMEAMAVVSRNKKSGLRA